MGNSAWTVEIDFDQKLWGAEIRDPNGDVWQTIEANTVFDVCTQVALLIAEDHEQLFRCVLCGGKIEPTNVRAEMFGKGKPRWGVHDVEVTNGIVHPQCGLDAGWEVS